VTIGDKIASLCFNPKPGKDTQHGAIFSYVSPERRVPATGLRAAVGCAAKLLQALLLQLPELQ
jgi:hypothetical protein